MSHTLVPVPASNEEHSCTVGDSSDNGTAGDNSTGRVDLAASTNVTAEGTTVTSTASRCSSRVCGLVWRTAVTW